MLDGLEAAFSTEDKQSPLEEKILLMSSASGGSMAVGNWIGNHAEFGDNPSSAGRLPLHEAATQPALEAVAWGLLHNDLWRLLFPFGKFDHDRAWFPEQANLAGLYLTNHPPPTGQSPDNQEIDEHWNSVKTLAELKPQSTLQLTARWRTSPHFPLTQPSSKPGSAFSCPTMYLHNSDRRWAFRSRSYPGTPPSPSFASTPKKI